MPRAVRHINEVRILESLYRHGTTTRADLARELGLMRSTVGNLVVGLIEQGLVTETELIEASAPSRTGRPGQGVALHAGHAAFIGADVGVGHLSAVAVNLLGVPVLSRTRAFEPALGDVDASIDALAELVRAVMQQLPASQAVLGLCLTVPGLVGRDGLVVRAPVLGWHAVQVQQRLVERLGWSGPVTLENDANAFAAAELFGRAPEDSADALYVYLDAGIGGGLASRGRLLRGQRGFAGEIGHIHLGEHGFDPNTAVQGSFESYVGRDAVVARFQHHGGAGTDLAAFMASLAAQAPPALRTISEWAWWLGRGLASLISVLDPGRIVLGGPVAALYAHAEQEVVDSIKKHLVAPFDLPTMAVSGLGTDACAIGGALMLHHTHLAIDERIVYGAAAEGG